MNAKHLKALKHLPEVIEALEALGKEKDRLQRALGRAGVATTATEAVIRTRNSGYQTPNSGYQMTAEEQSRWQRALENSVPLPGALSDRDRALQAATQGLHPLISGTANLETPERREFEEARRAGKVVPMELSEKELERRAFLAQTKAERQGLLDQFAGARDERQALDDGADPLKGWRRGDGGEGAGDVVTEGAPLNVSGS